MKEKLHTLVKNDAAQSVISSLLCILGGLIIGFIALLIIWLRPKAENWAFTAMWLGWLLMIYLYVGHTSGALLGNMNL